eukprot:TRINITY_DN21522_c0_g1_i1.p1 TRINITY_DN21522_c0_g1~~TRINITY_DN21522_c0_g1_i1.p1  ORF type:complete len:160 (+),score=30.70 TRINITY_DN21522_c0_g1_i1:44-523(+)
MTQEKTQTEYTPYVKGIAAVLGGIAVVVGVNHLVPLLDKNTHDVLGHNYSEIYAPLWGIHGGFLRTIIGLAQIAVGALILTRLFGPPFYYQQGTYGLLPLLLLISVTYLRLGSGFGDFFGVLLVASLAVAFLVLDRYDAQALLVRTKPKAVLSRMQKKQ